MIKNNVVSKNAGAPEGWTASALSLRGITGAGSAFFHAGGAVVGAVAGFNASEEGSGFVGIDHGIRFASGSAFVVEAGADMHAIGAYTESDEFEVRRVAQTVTYHRNGALLYTSEAKSVGAVLLDVSLFAAGDHVFNPRLVLGEGSSDIAADDVVPVGVITGRASGDAKLSTRETLLLVVTGAATGRASITPSEIATAVLRGIATGAARITPTHDGYAVISLAAVGRGTIKAIGAGQETLAISLEGGGTTRYEGFDFNSYAKIGAGYFGCRPDGIYQLDGDTDAGDRIRAMVRFGKQAFGTSALKRITHAYVGVSGRGRLILKVIAEGQEYLYAARRYDEELQVQRFDLGKGLRANWLAFELHSPDGEDFDDMASVEFAVVPLNRRI